MKYSFEIENLAQFLADLDRASREIVRETEQKSKEAGERILIPAISSNAPRKSGRLADGYKIVSAGGENRISNTQPYGRGAEWGKRGKWKGFRGNYAGNALDAKTDELAKAILEGISGPLGAYGWFR